ncbi:MAG: hypothetical protein K2O95_06685 [Clostridia bacterium]|nr:hypothetical protein [Clostridia bacterium]MDE7079783.1 hypothetical protein [Clostridia bacterium]
MKKTKFNASIIICLITVCLSLLFVGCGDGRKADDVIGEYAVDRIELRSASNESVLYYMKDKESIEDIAIKKLMDELNKQRYEIVKNENGEGMIYYTKSLMDTGVYAKVQAEYIDSVTFDKEYEYQYNLNMKNGGYKAVANIDGEFRIFRQIVEGVNDDLYALVNNTGYERAYIYYVKQPAE